ncbi:grasp-with-spasm system SPASM domain peptide maturase [uncultured Aquimarina sp.]|uniref:grasp-with-spasm system SPASM domain peptide maturase n=1 Tax=uncultured Aquimarina sp. TaxID=575652 RepID=UPI002612F837|nr:grasp-with-spasm system SPASM domain peptide maturase [uncultured Aquimarina sp.]
MKNKEDHFILFSTCIPVKGYVSSLIMDLDKGEYLEIPNELYDILVTDHFKYTIEEVKSLFNNDYDEGINQYFQYLVNNHYGFYTSNPSPFQKLPLHFDSPHKVISSIVVINKDSKYDLTNVFQQLDALDCQLLQIRIYDKIEVARVIETLKVLSKSSIRIIELYLPAFLKLSHEVLKNILVDFPRILITVYGAEKSKKVSVLKNSSRIIKYTNQKLLYSSKEVYSKNLFTVSREMFLESVNYNAGLYRKVCIDHEGSIKNYVSHETAYGNIKDNLIADIIQKEEFKEKYYLKNDLIEKCKDCQFRYMCLSNSDIEKKGKNYYKINTCTYNPYKNTWEPSVNI